MVKVLICEDDVVSVVERYGGLVRDHDVKVRLIYHALVNLDDRFKNAQVGYLASNGFNKDNVMFGLEGLSAEKADVIFVDGLLGKCLEVMALLPKDKTFLNTDNISYPILARREGYNVLEGSVKDKIRKLFGN